MHAFDVVILALTVASVCIAGWAAWTAHRARVWQQRRDKERSATVVSVETEHMVMAYRVASWEGGRAVRQPRVYGLLVTVVNHGEAPEYVKRLVLEPPAGCHGRGHLFVTFAGGGCRVPPRGQLVEHRQLGALPFDDSGGFTVVAELASGARIASEPQRRQAEIAATVSRQNQHLLR